MEKDLLLPRFPRSLRLALIIIVAVEMVIYGVAISVPIIWLTLVFAMFYLTYRAVFRHDGVPLFFALLFFTTHHSLLFNFNSGLPIALLFVINFAVASVIMWLLLHYATHLPRDLQLAYSCISGFLIAQIITLFASMAADWPFRFELAAYVAVIFSYVFWRFACLSSESMLGYKQFLALIALVAALIAFMVLGSPNVSV